MEVTSKAIHRTLVIKLKNNYSEFLEIKMKAVKKHNNYVVKLHI